MRTITEAEAQSPQPTAPWYAPYLRILRLVRDTVMIILTIAPREAGKRRDMDQLLGLIQAQARNVNLIIAHHNQLQARLRWYERNVPMLALERKKFDAHQKKLIRAEEAKARLAAAPVADEPDNGEQPHQGMAVTA